jgi:hypothetical protein
MGYRVELVRLHCGALAQMISSLRWLTPTSGCFGHLSASSDRLSLRLPSLTFIGAGCYGSEGWGVRIPPGADSPAKPVEGQGSIQDRTAVDCR